MPTITEGSNTLSSDVTVSSPFALSTFFAVSLSDFSPCRTCACGAVIQLDSLKPPPTPKPFDLNNQVTFTMPEHKTPTGEDCHCSGKTYIGYIAIHADQTGYSIRISTQPIAAEWWNP